MEDAVDALKMAFSVFAFVLALAIVFAMFSQAREVSDIVLAKTDNTYYTEYVSATDSTEGRIVGIETVIPTLYRYYKEKFSVDIKDTSNKTIEKFDEEIERLVYTRKKNYRDYIDLYPRGITWLANPNIDIQKRTSAYIAGKGYEVNGTKLTNYDSNNLKRYRNSTFLETFEQTNNGDKKYEGEDGSIIYLVRGTTKLHVTYTLQ